MTRNGKKVFDLNILACINILLSMKVSIWNNSIIVDVNKLAASADDKCMQLIIIVDLVFIFYHGDQKDLVNNLYQFGWILIFIK